MHNVSQYEIVKLASWYNQAQLDAFKRNHGTAFDPKSRIDRAKMKDISASVAAPAQRPVYTKEELNAFRKAHGSRFDANSRLDRKKMEKLYNRVRIAAPLVQPEQTSPVSATWLQRVMAAPTQQQEQAGLGAISDIPTALSTTRQIPNGSLAVAGPQGILNNASDAMYSPLGYEVTNALRDSRTAELPMPALGLPRMPTPQ